MRLALYLKHEVRV